MSACISVSVYCHNIGSLRPPKVLHIKIGEKYMNCMSSAHSAYPNPMELEPKTPFSKQNIKRFNVGPKKGAYPWQGVLHQLGPLDMLIGPLKMHIGLLCTKMDKMGVAWEHNFRIRMVGTRWMIIYV